MAETQSRRSRPSALRITSVCFNVTVTLGLGKRQRLKSERKKERKTRKGNSYYADMGKILAIIQSWENLSSRDSDGEERTAFSARKIGSPVSRLKATCTWWQSVTVTRLSGPSRPTVPRPVGAPGREKMAGRRREPDLHCHLVGSEPLRVRTDGGCETKLSALGHDCSPFLSP
jgi:hypothetical protein